jgi:hypothetical protein
MVEAKKLHQIIMTKLSSLFSHKITLDWCKMVTFKKKFGKISPYTTQ